MAPMKNQEEMAALSKAFWAQPSMNSWPSPTFNSISYVRGPDGRIMSPEQAAAMERAMAGSQNQGPDPEAMAQLSFDSQRYANLMGLAPSLVGEANRAKALGETSQVAGKLRALISQGGVLSPEQIAGQAARVTGQTEQQLAGQEAGIANQFAQAGIINPAAVAAATAGVRSGALGVGARTKNEAETQNALTLPGLLSGAAQVGQHRAGLQQLTSYEDADERLGGLLGDFKSGELDPYADTRDDYEKARKKRAEGARSSKSSKPGNMFAWRGR